MQKSTLHFLCSLLLSGLVLASAGRAAVADFKDFRVQHADNGIGMRQDRVEALLAEAGLTHTTALGNMGYRFIKDLLRMPGNTVHIESSAGKGTCVTILLLR